MGLRIEISRSKDLVNPNQYVDMLNGEFKDWAFNEEVVGGFKGKWREAVFNQPASAQATVPLDLEIGTGNGYYFAHHASRYPERLLIGIELKYKPLVQSIRRALRAGSKNMRIMRYDACFLGDIFAQGELNNVIIHFPDPWEKKRQWKHRLISDEFLDQLFELQRPGSIVDFKTDSESYFDWSVERFARSRYAIEFQTRNLHASEAGAENFVTHFESIFIRQGLPIYAARLAKS